MRYVCFIFAEYRDCYDEYRVLYDNAPETYSEPVLSYIVICDRKEQMVYEYSTYKNSKVIENRMEQMYNYFGQQI